MTLYHIHWRTLNGRTGRLKAQLIQAEAERIADEFNHTLPGLVVYWIEPVPTAAEATPPGERSAEPGAAAGAARDTAGQS